MIIIDRNVFRILGFKCGRGFVNELESIVSMRRHCVESRVYYNTVVKPPDRCCENGRSSRLIEIKDFQVAKPVQEPLMLPDQIRRIDFEGQENVRI